MEKENILEYSVKLHQLLPEVQFHLLLIFLLQKAKRQLVRTCGAPVNRVNYFWKQNWLFRLSFFCTKSVPAKTFLRYYDTLLRVSTPLWVYCCFYYVSYNNTQESAVFYCKCFITKEIFEEVLRNWHAEQETYSQQSGWLIV